jgi:eukaryotic-like serine/threonine-protein kinase
MDTTLPSPNPAAATGLTEAERKNLSPRYDIVTEVGRGGMGIVYLARHRMLDRQVAIKVCLPGGPADRFQREAQLLARMRSPHVVAVHDFDQLADGRALLVMDWIDGADLAKMLRSSQGPLPEARVLPWMRQVCDGMRTAAEQGIIHRDLKPSNILIDSQDVARVGDFGLARSLDADLLTVTGGLLGTPYYMAPEQAEDPRRVDTRTDIYSFGATFYHVLTGEPPFRAETAFSILFKHKTEPLIAPRARNPLLSAGLSDCLERCLAKAPPERFPAFGDVLASLQPSSATTSAWDAPDEAEVHPHMASYRRRRAAYLTGPELRTPDQYTFPHQRVIVIGHGNLAEQKVDALVSSDDDVLSMGGGVSHALSSAAGPELYNEAAKFVPVRPGRAIVTTAGALPARFVFHAVMMGYGGNAAGEWVRPSRDLINEIMESCFYHADTLGVQSIAFPLLGTGVGRFPRDACLDAMFRFLVRKFSRGVTTVREARIIVFQGQSD